MFDIKVGFLSLNGKMLVKNNFKVGDLMILYIVEDTLHCVYKGNLISAKFSSLEKGYIIDKDLFILEFNKLLKNKKVKTKIFGEDITFVNNGYFTIGELFFIENIFNELGFIKVEFLDIRELLPVMDVIFVEVNNNYMILYLKDILYVNLNYFKDIPMILNVLKSYFSKDIAFLGLNKCIPKMYIKNVNYYYIENYSTYITQSLLKVKK